MQENQDEDRETKAKSAGRSNSTRRNRAAAVHNQSERVIILNCCHISKSLKG